MVAVGGWLAKLLLLWTGTVDNTVIHLAVLDVWRIGKATYIKIDFIAVVTADAVKRRLIIVCMKYASQF